MRLASSLVSEGGLGEHHTTFFSAATNYKFFLVFIFPSLADRLQSNFQKWGGVEET